MPKISGKMNEREQAICGRLKIFREAIRWSQADVAKRVGVSRDQISGVEYARVPLSAALAIRLSKRLQVSLYWLVTNEGSMTGISNLYLVEDAIKRRPRALLSDVLSSFTREQIADVSEYAPDDFPADVDLDEVVPAAIRRILHTVNYKERRGAGKFYVDVVKFVKRRLEKDRIRGVMTSIDPKQYETRFAFFRPDHEKDLTETATSAKSSDVKPKDLWPALKRKLQAATGAAPGAKSALAKFLGVELSRVSQWLSDSKKTAREPGAEYALLMQAWLNDPRRAK